MKTKWLFIHAILLTLSLGVCILSPTNHPAQASTAEEERVAEVET